MVAILFHKFLGLNGLTPPDGRLKMNWDVAVMSCRGNCIGVGVIVRDSKGLVIAAMSKTVEGLPAPVIAKAMGALQAAEFSIDLAILWRICRWFFPVSAYGKL
jgi:hypothetical protein